MNENQIYHLSYVSTGTSGLSYEHIKSILENAIEHNRKNGITGILIYCNNHFFQILEGAKEDIEALFARILIDSRHDNVIRLQSSFIDSRQFESWSMAFKSYNKELKNLDDFNTEEFYGFVKSKLNGHNVVSLKILADFFDLNG